MITPRRTRLLRVPDLARFQTALTDFAGQLTPASAPNAFVLVPTRAAGEQLRRTFEYRLLSAGRPALVLPVLGTRADWHDELASRLSVAPYVLNPFEREVMLASAARAVAERGLAPPFEIRPGLIAEMLALYDLVRRLGRSVTDFDRNLRAELERDREFDRGAEMLFQQTVFLTAAFQEYQSRAAALGASDEHGIRELLVETSDGVAAASYIRPITHVVVTVGDRVADPDGLWPSDFELLTRLPHLESIDVVCTEALLSSGLLERLHGVLPDVREERAGHGAAPAPLLVTPVPDSGGGAAPLSFSYRDREEELAAVVRRLKTERRSGANAAAHLHRTALVVRRPLPYLYVARDVFRDGGIPFEALDTLPLAAEPYAAAVDVVLAAITADFTRTSVIALLRSPHFEIGGNGRLPRETIAAIDVALADARYLGGLDRLTELGRQWNAIDAPTSREDRRRMEAAPGTLVVTDALAPLAPLAQSRSIVTQIDTLITWLRQYDAPPVGNTASAVRRWRVRAAVLGALTALADAYRAHDPEALGDVTILAATIRRWLGSQTIAASSGEPGLQIVDAQAARFGEFDDVQLVGLIDGEWPERARRNVLYPASLLAPLEPLALDADPSRRERDGLHAARAAFHDLVHLARHRVRVSTFVLEHDAIVEPSILLDELDVMPLARESVAETTIRVFRSEALALEPRFSHVLDEGARRWAEARLDEVHLGRERFQGQAGAWTLPRVSVSRLERYLDCPFRFFASEVLQLEEQPEDEDTRTPLERGRFLHELFERFFAEWQRMGHQRIDATSLGEARQLFTSVCEEALASLPPAEATLERTRLLGSAVSPGIAHRVFSMEAERATDVVERLLEFPLRGDFRFRALDGRERTVSLSAKTDRIDLLADGTLRVIDYKTKKTPDLKVALQLPIYSHCAHVSLTGHRSRTWTLSEALYVSFEGDRAVVPFRAKGRTMDELIAEAQDRLLATLDRIAEGRFPPQPSKKSLCGPCPYAAVCRLDYVEREESDRDG